MTESKPNVPLRPTAGRVLLARKAVPECYEGTSIKIPDDVRYDMERWNVRATVLEVGKSEGTETCEFKKGDEVFIDRHAGSSVTLHGSDLILTLARFGEVMGVFTEPEEEPEPLIVVPESRIILP